jgi:hypothetical protein
MLGYLIDIEDDQHVAILFSFFKLLIQRNQRSRGEETLKRRTNTEGAEENCI